MALTDTIVAISTPRGEGAIGIVRLSGPRSRLIAERVFKSRSGRPLFECPPFRLTPGLVYEPETGAEIDEVLAVFMPAPRSYTCEDTVELQAHGGRVILEKIIQASLRSGARLAHPGEFTKRAFLNGRLDLAQAEAVIDLIRSRSEAASKLALRQLEGGLSQMVQTPLTLLTTAAAEAEAILDFSEAEGVPRQFDPSPLEEARDVILRLLSRGGDGRLLREGFRIPVVGRANVGKSSVFNKLLNCSRSIVTPLPGTTRDTIEEILTIDDVAVILMDSAGLGNPRDPAEEEGIKRSRESLLSADVSLVLIDASEPLRNEDRALLSSTRETSSLIVLNKIDLPARVEEDEVDALSGGRAVIRVSARSGEGIEELRRVLSAACSKKLSRRFEEDPVVINSRHQTALRRSLVPLERGLQGLAVGNTIDMVATDIRESLAILGEITGVTTPDDILDEIFSRFCVGK
jgi:tRNA modification GTPase